MTACSSTPMSSSMLAESSSAAQRVKPSFSPSKTVPSSTSAKATSGGDGDGDDESEDDGDAMDIKTLQSFNQKVQRFPAASTNLNLDPANPFNPPAAQKIIIPKRGEKDFEPLNETVNLQEMMLKQSREALFEALTGVRGGSSNNISHALLTPDNPFPHVVVSRGNVQASMGHTVRSKKAGKMVSRSELLPEEALYLTERGSLQLWYGPDDGEWSDEIYGINGAVEMSVMQAYATFIGKEGLTLERYQAYAYLKRLGYTVQRTRTFLPPRLRDAVLPQAESGFSWSQFGWLRPDRVVAMLIRRILGGFATGGSFLRSLVQRGLGPKHSLLATWHGDSYTSIFSHLRLVPSGHSQPVNNPSTEKPSTAIPATAVYETDPYASLAANPYIPFFHVWQPSVSWSRKDWLKGSEQGLAQLPPNFWLAVINVRQTSLPSLEQISDVFNILPHDPAPVWQPRSSRQAAQQQQPPVAPVPSRFASDRTPTMSYTAALKAAVSHWLELARGRSPTAEAPHPRSIDMHLKQGDRTLVVATADSGNIGWVRLGRGGFDQYPVA